MKNPIASYYSKKHHKMVGDFVSSCYHLLKDAPNYVMMKFEDQANSDSYPISVVITRHGHITPYDHIEQYKVLVKHMATLIPEDKLRELKDAENSKWSLQNLVEMGLYP